MNAQVANASQMRPMQQTDIETVDAIEQRAYEFPWTAGIFRDCLKSGHQAWVLDCRAGIIGYGVLTCAAGEAHLLNICIAPEHQGHGHGRRLPLLRPLARLDRAVLGPQRRRAAGQRRRQRHPLAHTGRGARPLTASLRSA